MFILSEKKRGRPKKFENSKNSQAIEEKKYKLFGTTQSQSEYINLINLAYQTGKINKEEFELAGFLEKQFNLKSKYIEAKGLPKNSPTVWGITSKINSLSQLKQNEQAFRTWNKIEKLLKQHTPKIADEFIKLISSHHTYEELLILKMNQTIMQILKNGLKTLNNLIELGYLL